MRAATAFVGSRGSLLQCLLLAALAALGLFLWQGHQSFNIADEGYLWYGVQRTMVGEVPLRDFSSYDPGRYYVAAALMSPWNDNGLVALRAASAVVQVLVLFLGLTLVARSTPRSTFLFLLPATIILAVWMFPWFKLADIGASIALVGALSFLIREPSLRRYFLAGVILGLAAVFGRNHGIYGLAGGAIALCYLALGRRSGPDLFRAGIASAAGVALGYLPVLLMIVAIPGFARAFWDSILFLFQLGATNAPLPVPWPWRVAVGELSFLDASRGVIQGLFFIALLAYGALGLLWMFSQRLRGGTVSPTLAASFCLALPYAHYSFSRAGVTHLALGIFPLLSGCLAWLASKPPGIKWPLTAALCGASLLVALPKLQGWTCRVAMPCIEADISGSRIMVPPYLAADIAMLKRLADQFAPGDRSFIAVPMMPGAYAVLGRKSPLWDIYPILPRNQPFEEAEIARIKASNPGFAVIVDYPLDGRQDLLFRFTHPLVDAYIRTYFGVLPGYGQNSAYQVYRSRLP